MKVIYNNELLLWREISLTPTNRGFRYGDGLFETIAVVNGVPRFLDKHLARLKSGAKILRLDVEDFMDFDAILNQIVVLQNANNLTGNARVRLLIWRDSDCLFSPADGNTHYLLTIDEANFEKKALKIHAGFSESTVNYPSAVSKFKTLSALKYVLAGIEKKESNLDEILLKDYRGYISETLVANLFWKKADVYGTPPIDTGCVDGIMRDWLMNELAKKGHKVVEQLIERDELMEAEYIFTTNSMGIRHITSMDSKAFEVDMDAQSCIDSIN